MKISPRRSQRTRRKQSPCPPWWNCRLEHIPQRELNLAPGVSRIGDPAEVSRPPSGIRILEGRCIRQVEEFRTELQPMVLSDIEVLEDRQIRLDPSGAVQIGLADGAKGPGGRRLKGTARQIDFLDHPVFDDRSNTGNRIGSHRGAAATVADGGGYGKGIPALGEETAVCLPAG